nr:hypothetical protein [Tanacetum cinerariifolium]
MVDFLEASHLRYALTVNPTIYVSYLRQFWSTARIETTKEGTKILATVDGIVRTVSESSLRRNLKLRDEDGISSLRDTELFENLTLMGYNISPNQKFTFQKGTPTEPHHTPSQEVQPSSHPYISSPSIPTVTSVPTIPIPTVIPSKTTPIRQYTRRTRIAQSSVPPTVADKPASPQRDVTPRVTSPAAVEGSFNEFSSNIATDVVCLATNRVYNFSKMIFDGMLRNVNNKGSKILMYPRKFFTTLRVNSPSLSGKTVPLFPTMLVTMGEGSGTPTEPHHTPTPEAQQSPRTAHSSPLLLPVTTESIPTVIPTDIPSVRQYSRRARIAQSSALLTAADESASPLGDESQKEAFPTISGSEAKHDRENIIKTSALDHDSPPKVTSLAADPSGEDATIKGRSLEIEDEAGIEKSTERGSNDTKELVNVLTSLDAASILTSGVQMVSVPPAVEVATVSVPTGSGMVPTASLIFTTASVVTPYSRRKGKEKMVESDILKKKKLQEQIDILVAREMEEQIARKDQRMNEQIARDAEISKIHAEEELQMLIDGLDRNNETVAKYLQEYEQFAADLSIREKIVLINELVKYQDHHSKILKYQAQQSKPLSKKQQREFYMSIEDFVPMASKEERERFKRKGLRLEQESPKKMKTSKEVSEEYLKEMMQLVPVEEVYVEALPVKHLIIDWEIHIEGQRSYWKIIRLGGNITVYQFFVDMLKHFDRE